MCILKKKHISNKFSLRFQLGKRHLFHHFISTSTSAPPLDVRNALVLGEKSLPFAVDFVVQQHGQNPRRNVAPKPKGLKSKCLEAYVPSQTSGISCLGLALGI